MEEPVTLAFIFQTIGIILVLTTVGIVLVKNKENKIKGNI